MRLSNPECIFILRAIKAQTKNPNRDPYDQKFAEKLIPFLTEVTKLGYTPYEKRNERTIDIPLEDQLAEEIAESITLRDEIQDKIDFWEKVRANLARNVWEYFFITVKIILIFALLGASLYTIAHLVPKEWAIWAPLPIAAGLALWELCGRLFNRWYHGHWKNK